MFSSIILFGSFFLFLALGVPIAFVLIVATVSYALLSTGDANLALVPQRIIYGIVLPCFVFHSSLWQEIL